ncbi:MAG TPA: hypothetical protein VJ987_05190, partial [Anaerolineales bacterium]|nr:hypothetical protein [Anaerolineales bacterium]
MKLSIKQSPIGKPSRIPGKAITYGWQSADLTPAKLIAHIEAGKPFAVAQFKDGHRSTDHFMSSDVIALDIDKNDNDIPLTEDEARAFIAHPYIQQNAFAVIESFNSKPDAYKFRVLFHLSETIIDAADYAALVELVQREVPFTDPAARDAARAFMGGKPGRTALYTNENNSLDIVPLRKAAAHEKTIRQKAYLERLNQAKEL